jgi:uncharacterized protein YjbJ (UPF0337 family)
MFGDRSYALLDALPNQEDFQEVRMKDAIKGKAEEVKGKMTGDKGEELKGKGHQMVDKIKSTGRDARDDVKDEVAKQREENETEREAETVQERRSR